jgi:putative tryptophan/tyrosine transport system substrate-binding protein
MRRRDFTIGLLLASATRVRAQERVKQHRIAIIIPAGPVAVISATSSDTLTRRFYQPFFEELRRLGDVEGQNLIVERYSGEGRPGGFADLAREVAGRNPDAIVVISNGVGRAARAAIATIPIVWIGVDPIGMGLATSLAHPGGNITGVSLFDAEFYAKRLQILKDAVCGVQDRVAGAARGVGRSRWTSNSTSVSGSRPTIGNVGNPHAAPGGDIVRVSAHLR